MASQLQDVRTRPSFHLCGNVLTLILELDPTLYPHYLWYPGVLANASNSAEYTTLQYQRHLASLPEDASLTHTADLKSYLRHLVKQTLGIHDPSTEELASLIEHPLFAPWTFADMISRRSQTGWSTHGHSAVDVNIYASDPRAAHRLRGNHENTEVGEFLRWYLDLDDEVEKVTKKLKDRLEVSADGVSWLGEIPGVGERLDGQDHLEHYHGDFKMR